MRKTTLKCLFILMCVGGLAQCGGDDALSSKVDMSINPDTPIVISQDITYVDPADNENLITVAGPWFRYSLKVTNKSDQQLTVVSVTFKITATNGASVTTSEITLDPSVLCDEAPPGEIGRPYLAIIEPGDTYRGLTDDCDYLSISDDIADADEFFMSSLPTSTNFVYSIQYTAEGWFEKNGEQTERFKAYGAFGTR